MKKVLFTLALLVSFSSFGQQWNFNEGGNAFDGFYRIAGFDLVDYSSYLVVINTAEEIKLEWGVGGENKMDKLKIAFLAKGISNPKSLKMSFDNERKVYDIDFFFNEEKSITYLSEAYSNNYSKLHNKFSIIDLFKKHNKVNFRISNGDKKIDFSYPLTGFTKAVNKAVIYNNSDRDEELNTIAMIGFMGLIPADVRTIDVFTNCLDFLNKFGKYYSNLVNSIELIIDKDLEEVSYLNRKAVAFSYFSKLIFKDKYGNFLKSIQGKDFLKGALQSSGNLKEYDGGKLIKDEESLRLLYEIVSQEDNWLSLSKLYEEGGFITNGVFSSNEEYLNFIESASIEEVFPLIEEGTFTDLTEFKNYLGVGLKSVSFEDFIQLSKEMIFKYYSFSYSSREIRVHFSDSEEGSLDIISLETFSEPWGNLPTN
tara:strand:+ start:504 stop:1778 length:1275 start_codon:yes stop_codon:yes gene_type:complete